jgi:hypothetical protein
LARFAQVDYLVDGAAKLLAIDRVIGRRPVIAFGNADGDRPMLEWTSAGDGPRFAVLVHHTDGEWEYAYDRTAKSGKLDRGRDEAGVKGWLVVDMKDDWMAVFKPDSAMTKRQRLRLLDRLIKGCFCCGHRCGFCAAIPAFHYSISESA